MNKEQFFDALMNNKRLVTRDGRRVELASYDNQAAKPFTGFVDFGDREVVHSWMSNGHIISDEEKHDFDIVGFYVDPPALTTEQMFDALMNRKALRTRTGLKVTLIGATAGHRTFSFSGRLQDLSNFDIWPDAGWYADKDTPSKRDIIGYWED
ncbi:hypothetical protein HPC37_02925 [Pasteurellaceae bacterium 20609_3]|uniref:hypothetical protein n=1 Tax=Spirabiliibacterium mucosae TaxID=28156 RepID=UPI001AAC4CF7|nr:hypothetical protein [Spirabiliibacterium mucosae]MBE2897808.1 hypothetical protein [Spirabiliibacterium mucosae]